MKSYLAYTVVSRHVARLVYLYLIYFKSYWDFTHNFIFKCDAVLIQKL